MPTHVLIVDFIGAIMGVAGFAMAFRQDFVRRFLGIAPASAGEGSDPAAYGLRIAGVMIMVFGPSLGLMLTMFNLS